MSSDMTSAQSNALSLILATVGEGETPRTYEEFLRIDKKLPRKLDAIVYDVNKLLAKIHENRPHLSQTDFICYFKVGDRKPVYRPFYRKLGRETIRQALIKSGMWEIMKTGKIAILETNVA